MLARHVLFHHSVDVLRQFSDIVSLIEFHGVDMNGVDAFGRKAVDIGIWSGGTYCDANIELDRILLTHGAEFNLITPEWESHNKANILHLLRRVPEFRDGLYHVWRLI